MSRDANGTYALPLPDVVTGTTIEASWANQSLNDIKTALTDSLSRSGLGSMSAPLKLPDGAAAAAALSWTSEANSGLYRAAAGEIRMAVGGVDMMRWSTANGVQIYDSTWKAILADGTVESQSLRWDNTAGEWVATSNFTIAADGTITSAAGIAAAGDITTSAGAIANGNVTLAATGAITAPAFSVAADGSITAPNVSIPAAGNIAAPNFSVAVDGSVVATKVTAPTLHLPGTGPDVWFDWHLPTEPVVIFDDTGWSKGATRPKAYLSYNQSNPQFFLWADTAYFELNDNAGTRMNRGLRLADLTGWNAYVSGQALTGSLGVWGGAGNESGSGVVTYGGSHATHPNKIRMVTNGTERVTISSAGETTFSGKVTAPSVWLSGGTSAAGFEYYLSQEAMIILDGTGYTQGSARPEAYISYNTNTNVLALGTTAASRVSISSTGTVTLSSLGTGTVYSNAGVLTNTNPSDLQLKTNVQELTAGLAEIQALRPVTFEWRSDAEAGTQFGLIAQEVAPVMPDLVADAGGGYLGLKSDQLVPVLIKAVQQLAARVEELERKL